MIKVKLPVEATQHESGEWLQEPFVYSGTSILMKRRGILSYAVSTIQSFLLEMFLFLGPDFKQSLLEAYRRWEHGKSLLQGLLVSDLAAVYAGSTRSKHWDPKFRKLRAAKVLKVSS